MQDIAASSKTRSAQVNDSCDMSIYDDIVLFDERVQVAVAWSSGCCVVVSQLHVT